MLSGDYRLALARHAGLSFAATVAHICRGLRKLAATTFSEDVQMPLYRGVRGALPPRRLLSNASAAAAL